MLECLKGWALEDRQTLAGGKNIQSGNIAHGEKSRYLCKVQPSKLFSLLWRVHIVISKRQGYKSRSDPKLGDFE